MTLKKMMTPEGLPLVQFEADDLRRLFGPDLPDAFMQAIDELAESYVPYADPMGSIILDRAGFLSLCYLMATGQLPPA